MARFGRVLQPTDEKAEVMKACWRQGSTGEYQPVEVFDVAQQMSHSQIMTTSMTRSEQGRRRRQHITGRAGGGWESDENEEEEEQLQGEIVKTKPERGREQVGGAPAGLSAQPEHQG